MTRPRRPSGHLASALLLLAVGCRGADRAVPDQAVATWRGGRATVDDVERLLGGGRTAGAEAAAGAADWLERYREGAERFAVDRLVLADLGGAAALEAAIETLPGAAELRRTAILDEYLLAHRQDGPAPVAPADVERYYDTHRERFARPAQRFVWHIFRRSAEDETQEQTLAFLADLRTRADRGEVFGLLARAHSHSETRHLDGRLGWIGRGRLPPKLESIVFALPAGGTSEPLPVDGGGILVHVSQAVEEQHYALEDVRGVIAQYLAEQARRAWIAEHVAEVPTPDDAVVLEDEVLPAALAGDPDAVVLDLAGRRMTAGELRRRIAEDAAAMQPFLEARAHAVSLYRALADEQRLVLRATADGFLDDPAHSVVIHARVVRDGHAAVVDRRLRERMIARAEAEPAALRRFFEDNRHLYQSPLRLAVETLSLPLGRDGAGALEQLEALRAELEAGALTFEDAAARVGGRIDDLGWLDAGALEALEPKVRSYLLQLGRAGYAVPYQLSRRLVLPRIATWDEPRELPYEAVAERVRDDYVERSAQRLYREVVDALLNGAGYRFHPEVVERTLGLGGPAADSVEPDRGPAR